MRYFLEIAYKGTHYHGWQIQLNAHTVQAEIEGVLQKIFSQKMEIVASGRTDTGVHASQQFAHLDTETPLKHYEHLRKINILLPSDIAIRNIYLVEPEAHARFDAIERSYQYHLSTQKKPFDFEFCTLDYRQYNFDKMNEAAQILVQRKDFQAFSKVKTEVNNFNCEIKSAYWQQKDDNYVFHITANRFLRGMVRTIVGTLMQVGLGKINLKDFEMVIIGKDRKKAGHAAPPEGLFLSKVTYPYELRPIE
jgi:tRNA pseudouridine38-40 synthase